MKSNRRLITILGAVLLALVVLVGAAVLFAEPLAAVAGVEDIFDAEDEAEGPDEPITGEALDQASAAALEYLGEGRVTDTEVGDEEGYYEVEVTLDNGDEVDVHLDENFNVLGEEVDGAADEREDEAEDEAEGPDQAITGPALDQASAAALEYLGEGRVTATEVGDEEGYYEVEVTLEDGSQVDVHLDENFNVLGQEADGQEDED